MEESITMYPRVKVRVEKEEDEEFFEQEDESFVQEERCSLPLSRILESVSLKEHSLPGISSASDSGKVSQNDFSPSVAGVSAEATTTISISKGVKNNKEIDEETRIRASSVLRPRAVISSPEKCLERKHRKMVKLKIPSTVSITEEYNDWMIGSINRLARERSSHLKKNNLDQKSPPQVKIKCIRAAGPMSKGSDDSGDHKSCLNEKKSPELKGPSRKHFH